MKITITRALSERTVILKQIEKDQEELKIIAVQHGSKLKGLGFSHILPKDFETKALASIQSLESKQKRLLQIKTKIDISNSQTTVIISENSYTIREVLVKKTLLGLQQSYLLSLKRQYTKALALNEEAIQENNKKVEIQLSDWVKNNNNSKPSMEAEKGIRETVESIYSIKMINPCNLSEKIEKLEKEIQDFEMNVDYVLSESNSQTYIEIDD